MAELERLQIFARQLFLRLASCTNCKNSVSQLKSLKAETFDNVASLARGAVPRRTPCCLEGKSRPKPEKEKKNILHHKHLMKK